MSPMASQIAKVSIVLLNRLFRRRENIEAPRHWPFEGNSLVTGEVPVQRSSNTENVFIW